MKKLYQALILFFLLYVYTVPSYAQKALHSDSTDVLHYTITLDIFDFTNQTIKGNTELIIKPKFNGLQKVDLDLLALIIDSIFVDTTKLLTWNYNDTLLSFQLPQSYNITDTFIVTVYYYGHPQEDPGAGGWGGFKWSGNSAYNLGVGFAAIPHNFGRCWYPCLDDFIDRATYDFYITVDKTLNHMAVCNGTLLGIDTVQFPQKRTCHWKLSSEIPTYLASVAVNDYVAFRDTFAGIQDSIPIEIWVRQADALKVAGSFVNLKNILSLFENKFGPYRWERAGYVGVDFNAGAMEHATNIAVPNFTVTGNTSYEELFAHELSHHWFGDLATCHSAQDMWINEGWATFCEMVYEEAFFGWNTFVTNKRAKLKKVLQYNHIEEGAFVTLNQVPDSITYGSTSYDKGGLVTHTLRSYLGDSLFYTAVKDMLETYKFKDITSQQMRDYLTARTGIDMTGFFDNWVFSPGFSHFSVDSFKVVPNGINFDVTVYSRERLRGRTNLSVNNKVEVIFMDSAWQQITKTVDISNGTGINTFTIPFYPECAMMDLYEKTDDATSDLYKILKNTATVSFDNTYFTGIVSSVTDSAFVRAEHNWVAPDNFKNPIPGIVISWERYWKIDGIFPQNFVMKGKFYYSKATGSSSGYLDNQLITTSVDSLVLLYRSGPSSDWTIYPFYRSGNTTIGYLNTDTIIRGEYAFGIRNMALYLSTGEIYNRSENQLIIIPNPATQTCTIKYDFDYGDKLNVIDLQGKIIFNNVQSQSANEYRLSVAEFKPGLYFVNITGKNRKNVTGKIIVE